MLDSANPKREARAPLVTKVTVSSVSTSGYTLTVNSTNPSSGVGITVSPVDNNALGNGTTPSFVRTYNRNTQVTLTAPSTASGTSFSSWTNCDQVTSTTCTVTLAASRTVTANYGTATLAFTPAPGTYATTQTVTISDSTAGASIYYTTNGTTPTTSSTPYSGPITVSSTETIEAIASVSGNSIGAVATAAYTISPPSVNITGEWNWVGGSNIAGALAVPGTLGVAAPGNTPGAMSGETSWTDGSGNLWLFGGGGFGNALWEFSPSTNEWTLVNGGGQAVYGTKGVPAAANVPPGRPGAASWIDSSGKLWLFGGFDYADTDDNYYYFNDLWNYNPATKEWTWVNGPNSWQDQGVTGTPGIPDPANVPSGREFAVSWIDNSGNLWLFGGYGRSGYYYYLTFSDLWKYNPATNEWTWESGTSQINGGGTAVYGTQGAPAVGNVPGARAGAVSWTDGGGNFWLFGGSGNGGAPTQDFNDLWKLNSTNQMWTWVSGANTVNQPGVYGIQGIPSVGNLPGARQSAVSWIDSSGNFWLFGGFGIDSTGKTGNLNDLWMFNPTNKTWTWVSGSNTVPANGVISGVYGTQGIPAPANVPGARNSAVSWGDKNGNLWLFGGYGFDSTGTYGYGGGYLNDLWEFRQFTGTLSSITVGPANTAILAGRSQQFTATGTYSDSSTQNLTGTVVWTSSNTRVATVNSTGVVTAVAAGSTYISASLNGVSSNTVVLGVVSGAYTAPTETVGTASGTQTATILFSSSFTLGSISVVTQGATGLDFNYASGGTCTVGAAYTAGLICTVNYTFTPITPGQRMGAIVITDGSGNVQATAFISGMGTGPEAVFAPGIISTVAGNGNGTYNGDGIAATASDISAWGVVVDSAGNLYIADTNNQRIRKVSASTGLISTVAGNGTYGYNGDGIAATSAELANPTGVAVDGAGNIFIADLVNNRIRKVNASTGLISTVAGNGTQGYNGDGIAASSAELYGSFGVAVDSAGNLYIADSANSRIRKVSVSSGLISTVAGNGTGGFNSDGIAATSAELNGPNGVVVDSSGNIYIADYNRIRKVSTSTGLISTVAGNGTGGYNSDGIAATNAELYNPIGVAVDSAGNIYIGDASNNRARKVSANTGLISTVAGNGYSNGNQGGYNGDGITATSADLNHSSGVALDSAGNLYIADIYNSRIRKVSASTSGLSFASTAVGSTSSDSPQTVTLWNNGNTALTLPIPTSGNNPSIASNFTLNSTGGTACPLIGSTASSAGTLATGASCTLPISFAPTAAGTISGSLVVTDNSMNGSNVTQTISLGGTATSTSQTITFTPPSSPVIYGVSPITLSASASSGLYVTFSVLSGPGTVSGSTLTVTGVGTIVVAANQAGNTNYTAATQVTRSIVVNQATQTITFTAPTSPVTYGVSPITLVATGGASGNAVVFSIVSGPGTVTGSTPTVTGVGTVVVAANQTGNTNYSAATQVTQSIVVNQAAQTITFTAPTSPVTYGVAPITLVATGGTSGIAVVFSVVSGPGTVSNTTLTITGVGTVVVAANQAGNANYAAATQVTRSIVVNQAAQTITFTAPTSPVVYGVSPITLVATGGASGNAVVFSVVSGPATVSGSTLTITGVGTVVVAANQASNTNYAAATQVSQSITINQASQTITFTPPNSPVTYGVSPITLSASASSGLAVTFSVLSGPGTISSSSLTITGVGTVVVAANQAGNTNYSAATQVTQSIVVNVIGVAATPTFSPVAGVYTAAQTVSISDTTAGATIYYTTNGTTPTTSSTVYGGAITVSSTETLEAIATATGYSTSAVASAAYTINIPTNPVPAISGISPAFTNAGGAVFTLTVNGSGFIASSTVYWGTSALTTTYVSATQLTAQVPAADIATVGTIAITVQTPAPGGGTSNAWQFEVDSASSGSTAPTITSTTETVAAGSTASYPVTVPSSVTSVYVTCLNLPTGASCSYSSTTNTVTIATTSTTPKGTYQIIVVFTETVSGAASGFILLPILLLPLGFMRRKLAARGIWISACLGFVLLATAVLSIGCGGGSSGGSGSTTPPATHQVTSSGAVSLTVQ